MKIGIIGAENSHTAAIATLINIEKHFDGCEVSLLWGETDEFAQKAKEAGQIPEVVNDPRDMLGRVDAVIVDHRDGALHLPAVIPFVEAKIPTFVDKPLCCSLSEGKEFLSLARQHGTPVTSFSVLSHQESFFEFQESIKSIGTISSGVTAGVCDINSQWSGVFFYGIHQVDLALAAFGTGVGEVQFNPNGESSTATLYYNNGLIVTLNLLKSNVSNFSTLAIGSEGAAFKLITMDKSPYLHGVQTFMKMFQTGEEPETYSDILARVAVLEAIDRSIKADGRRETVDDFQLA